MSRTLQVFLITNSTINADASPARTFACRSNCDTHNISVFKHFIVRTWSCAILRSLSKVGPCMCVVVYTSVYKVPHRCKLGTDLSARFMYRPFTMSRNSESVSSDGRLSRQEWLTMIPSEPARSERSPGWKLDGVPADNKQ